MSTDAQILGQAIGFALENAAADWLLDTDRLEALRLELTATPEPQQEVGAAPTLSSEEATALVAAYFSEDHDAKSADSAIKRLGDWLDGYLRARAEADKEKQVEALKAELEKAKEAENR